MRTLIWMAAAAALFLSCDKIQDQPEDNTYKPLEMSTKSSEFIRKGQPFALDFLAQIDVAAEKDYVISPLSMQFLLGMILDGAREQTADEISKVLGYGAGEVKAVNEFCLSMLQQLPNLDRKTKISIANAIFVDDGWPLLDSYKADVSQYYKATVSNLDFADNAASLKAINSWCNDNTNGLIPKVLDKVDPDMLAYLLNALYFKGQWKEKFRAENTSDETFTDESGSTAKVKMMKKTAELSYGRNDVFQTVRLPYGNSAFSMYVLLPLKGYKVVDVISWLQKADWDKFRSSVSSYEVDLRLPRFETKYHIKLNDILSAMGMPSSFDPAKADFLGMSQYALCLSFVQQDAVIKVDEEGTEAAAISSAGMMKNTSIGPSETVSFHADHPFLYLITEASSGAILFAGSYSNR